MKLQLAFDQINLEEAKVFLEDVADLIDIVEIGTPLILREGIRSVSEIKKIYPDLLVLADLKIMDAGKYEANIAFNAGADIVTVLGVAHNSTITRVRDMARSFERKVMVDLIMSNNILKRATQLDTMGIDYVCIHTALDVQNQPGMNPLQELQIISPMLKNSGMVVCGGIEPNILVDIIPWHPEVIIIGGYIANHKTPRKALIEIRKLFVQGEK